MQDRHEKLKTAFEDIVADALDLETVKDAVVDPCGHSFSASTARKLNECPINGAQKLDAKAFRPNLMLRQLIPYTQMLLKHTAELTATLAEEEAKLVAVTEEREDMRQVAQKALDMAVKYKKQAKALQRESTRPIMAALHQPEKKEQKHQPLATVADSATARLLLRLAVEESSPDQVTEVLKTYVKSLHVDDYLEDISALGIAINRNDPDMVRHLLQHKAHPNANTYKTPPGGFYSALCQSIQLSIDCASKAHQFCVCHGQTQIIQSLLNANAAIEHNYFNAEVILFNHARDPKIYQMYRMVALSAAAAEKDVRVLPVKTTALELAWR